MLFGVFLTLGVAVFSVGLRSFQNSYAQKAGALGILAATFLRFISSLAAGCGGRSPQWAGSFFPGWKFSPGFARSGFRRKNSFGRKVRRLRTLSQRSARLRVRSKTKASCTWATPGGTGKIFDNFSGCFTEKRIAPKRRSV